MTHLQFYLPPELEESAGDLRRFFSAVIYKLRKNSGKGRWETLDLEQTLKLLELEVEEVRQAIKEGSYTEILLETADIGAFAAITSSIALRESEKGPPGEFISDINVIHRSSSPAGPGPEQRTELDLAGQIPRSIPRAPVELDREWR